uniref:Uncharacterized protein n=1 Tax=Fagus sylvatica TaxID=28930 RepID=A0A2N9G123_FAGSY
MSKWADLPCDVLLQIIHRLSSIDDIIISSVVCKSWQSLVNSFEKPPLPPSCPWLMLAEENEQSDKSNKEQSQTQTRSFFNLLDTKVYNFKLPEVAGRKYFGTSLGWLLTIGTDLHINLLHPLSKHLLSLPPQATFRCQFKCYIRPELLSRVFLKKAVLSKSPWNSATHKCDCDCVIMVIYGQHGKLAFTRPGYKAWIDIKSSRHGYADIVFYKGKFYAVDFNGVTVVCCFDGNKKARAKAIVPAPEGINMNIQRHIQKYIVESSGDLLLVSRFRGGHFYSKFYSFEEEFDYKENESNDEDPKDDFEDENSQDDVEDEGTKDESDRKDINDKPYVTIRFKVQKLERCTQEGSEFKYKWVKVDSLGDQTLFVGDSSSVVIDCI